MPVLFRIVSTLQLYHPSSMIRKEILLSSFKMIQVITERHSMNMTTEKGCSMKNMEENVQFKGKTLPNVLELNSMMPSQMLCIFS